MSLSFYLFFVLKTSKQNSVSFFEISFDSSFYLVIFDGLMENNELELSWLMRFRIVAALSVGIVLVGFFGYRFIAPADATYPAGLLAGSVTIVGIFYCCVLAFLSGFFASALSVPYGRQLGPLAAPAGLCFWALRTGSLSTLLQGGSVDFRIHVYSLMRYSGFVWFCVIAFGLLGSFALLRLFPQRSPSTADSFRPMFRLPYFLVIVLSVCGTVFISERVICFLAGNVSYFDPDFGSVYGSPGSRQVAFAVLSGFSVAAFLAKYFLGSSFLWPSLAVIPLTYYVSFRYGRPDLAEYMSVSWPAVFFIKPTAAILPLQFASFGSLGAIFGYWLAARFHLWRSLACEA